MAIINATNGNKCKSNCTTTELLYNTQLYLPWWVKLFLYIRLAQVIKKDKENVKKVLHFVEKRV